jgi:hypothetical protein
MDRTWKAAERAVARLLGGHRTPCSGAAGGADVDAGWCSVEVKHRRKLPVWLEGALLQAERSARDGQLAVVVLHEHGRRYAHSLVVLRLGAFVDWFGPLAEDGAETGAEDGDDAAG